MISMVRNIEKALGDGEKVPMPCEIDTKNVARKSIMASRQLSRGAVLKREDIAFKRPGTGLA